MNLQQHKEAWVDFVTPFLVEYIKKYYPQVISVALINDPKTDIEKEVEKWFLRWSFEMQLGVYLKYLKENNLWVYAVIQQDKNEKHYAQWWVKDMKRDIAHSIGAASFDDAYEYAIEEAFRIRNEQLKS